MAKLIIFDVYGTLIKADYADGVLRPGLRDLLAFYKDKLKVTCSDGDKETVEQDLESVGLYNDFDQHYFADNLIMLHRRLKNLKRICFDANLPVSEAVFIGDNHVGRDEDSARAFNVRFIKVPQFRQELPESEERISHGEYVRYEDAANPFSFTSLIGKL